MSFRLVSSGGGVSDPAFVNLAASGVVSPGIALDFVRVAGQVVGPSGVSSTQTMVFGVCAGPYAQGASDVFTKVIPFESSQLWEVDCANAALTAQVGLRHTLSSNRGFIHNTSSDVTGTTGVFLALGMTGLTTGSGKLIGRFISNIVPYGQNQTTYN